MSIISLPLVNQLPNGSTADGGQVLADLNAIASQVNANAAKNGINDDITQLVALLAVPSDVSASGWTLALVTINSGTISGVDITATNALLTTPTLTGGTLNGVSIDSASSAVTQVPGTNTTQIATMAALVAQAFLTALPGQATHADNLTTTDGATASWTNLLKASVIRFKDGTDATKLLAFDVSGVTTATTRTLAVPNKNGTMALISDVGSTLLATLTPTAAANVDFLTTFSATYDQYLIIGDGLKPATDSFLNFRFANAGVVDSGANYFGNQGESATPVTVAATSGNAVSTTVTAAGLGSCFVMHVLNANDATNLKSAVGKSVCQTNATPGYALVGQETAYVAASAISGIRFLWASGGNFAATGRIRIYGISN